MSAAVDRPEEAARFRLLEGEILLFRRSPAEAARLISEPIPDTPAFAALKARQTQLQGQRELVEGRLDGAVATLEGAAQAARSAEAIDVALDADVIRGQALVRLQRTAEGVALLERAAAQAAAAGD
ncbi:MAG TPA: hypothetical protein VFV95_03570, partial [Vicinamibacterales bacterium]|nr:hypothetical protein [Vicinamibacterales bacterium]